MSREGLSSVFPQLISTVFCIVAKKIMKSLLCSSSFDKDEELIEHCITYHRIQKKKKKTKTKKNRSFLQKLFQSNKNSSVFRKRLR